MNQKFLIAGLGNPGKEYENTRHNIGYIILNELAKDWQVSLQEKPKFKGLLGQKSFEEKTAYLLLPATYMNLSGISVKKCMDYFQMDIKNLLIIVDDVHIPFGQLRLKKESGTGGHNGLESIRQYLHTDAYARLRIGIGGKEKQDLVPHVLGSFSEKEKRDLPDIADKAKEVIFLWMEKGIDAAMNLANIKVRKEHEK